jgi:DNA polymerase III delta prime subunit
MADRKLVKWQNDLEIFSRTNPVLIIEGNIFDRFMIGNAMPDLNEYLYRLFHDRNYRGIVFYDPVLKGFYCPMESDNPSSLFSFGCACGVIDAKSRKVLSDDVRRDEDDNYTISCGFKGVNPRAQTYIRRALSQKEIPAAVILNLASHMLVNSGHILPDENELFTSLLKSGLEGQSARDESTNGTLKNLLILIVNKVNDLPAWFYLNNPTVKIIHIDTPTPEERQVFMEDNIFRSFFKPEIYSSEIGDYSDRKDELLKLKNKFIGLTEGLSYVEINSLRNLCRIRGFRISELPSVVDYYRFGIATNPWEAPDLKTRVLGANLNNRVKGQSRAIAQTMSVVKRSITGLSGLQHSSSHSKPRGVLFFAGPTGTGKTETAKALAELIFRDEKNCIRFDMSEFMQPHSDQRLFGAPPGYVGYEAGGQLTNAVREHPFSILLFDEIEKAHSSILDKFLQILEDGRMTDGQGKTVYFSECIIIFTSNLGIYTRDPSDPSSRMKRAAVDPSYPYSEVESRVRTGVENYFKHELGRPEILNRIGDNIVVFDFIREDIAGEIVTAQVQKIRTNLAVEKGITLTLSDRAMQELKSKASGNLENGGRGIGNIVESCLINPLACHIFDNNISAGGSITIDDIRSTENGYVLICGGGGDPGTGISARSESSVSSSEQGTVSVVRQQNPDSGISGSSGDTRTGNENQPSDTEAVNTVPERADRKTDDNREQSRSESDPAANKPDHVIDPSLSDHDVSGSTREKEPQSLSFNDIFGSLFSEDNNKDQKKKEKKSIDDFLKGD